VGKIEERDRLDALGVDGRVIWDWIYVVQDREV
jgi:hypothetical protein